MNCRHIFSYLVAAVMTLLVSEPASAVNYIGGDISLLPDYEEAGAIYKDHDGNTIAELLPWMKEEGMNTMRVRLFVNPDRFATDHAADYDPNAKQDLDYILPLCKRIVDNGFDLILDFHYSDTWADPVKQWTPDDWTSLTEQELCVKIEAYTRTVLTTLKENGVAPSFIQTGNEISYGMLWGAYNTSTPLKCYTGNDANWSRFASLLKRAGTACREVFPDAKIIIHTERVANSSTLTNIYQRLADNGVEYDIIGLSYYPYFHGDLSVLDGSLTALETKFPEKKIMVVETGYTYCWQVGDIDVSGTWEYSDEGQNDFTQQLGETLSCHSNVIGLIWWWPEYNAFNTTLEGWYQAPLFDSRTGCATSALSTFASFAAAWPEPKAPATELYISGDFNGWKLTDKFSEKNGVYTIKALEIGSTGKFKITSSDWSTEVYGGDGWSTIISETSLSAVLNGTGNAILNITGTYDVTFDKSTLTVTFSPTPEGLNDLYLTGDFNEWAIADDMLMSETYGTYAVYGVTFTAAGKFKISNKDWTTQYGGATISNVNESVTLQGGKGMTAGDIVTELVGTYDIFFNSNTNALTIYNAGEAPSPYPVLYLVGDFNEWTIDEGYQFEDNREGKYTLKGARIAKIGTFQISDGSWSIQYGGDGTKPNITSDNMSATLEIGGFNRNAYCSITGVYDITFDINTQVITFAKSTFEGWWVNVIGDYNGWGDNGRQIDNEGFAKFEDELIGTSEFKIKVWDGRKDYYYSVGAPVAINNWIQLTGDNPVNMTVAEAVEGNHYAITYDAHQNAIYITPVGANGIADITTETADDTIYYNLQGNRVDNPVNGVYIKVVNGKASKIMAR